MRIFLLFSVFTRQKVLFQGVFCRFFTRFFCSTWNSSLLRCRRGDAHRVFDVAILLFPVGRGRYPIVGHQPDGMVDGVHKDAHIPDHGDAVPPFCGAVEQLFDVQVGLTGVEPPLGNVDERLAAAVLRQAQHGPRVTLGEVVVQHELALVPRELQQAQLVGQCGLRHAQPLGGLGLGAVPQHQNVPQALRLLKGVQVGALNIFQQAEGRRLLIGIAAQDGRNGGHLGQLAGAQPPLPCHQLVTFGCFTHRDGLQQTVFTDALGKACQLLFLKGPARLERRRMDLVDGQEENP